MCLLSARLPATHAECIRNAKSPRKRKTLHHRDNICHLPLVSGNKQRENKNYTGWDILSGRRRKPQQLSMLLSRAKIACRCSGCYPASHLSKCYRLRCGEAGGRENPPPFFLQRNDRLPAGHTPGRWHFKEFS